MTRGIEQRLRKLESANDAGRRLHLAFPMTPDAPEWNRQISDLIETGQASADDEFMRLGWNASTMKERQSTGPVLR
jgi:hypothetical protein